MIWFGDVKTGDTTTRVYCTHLTADLADGALGYVEPIRIEALCLNCHGETLTEPVQARLAELYPEDRATGFADGDLRGLFWAVVPPGS